jgi:5-methyltetrahydropteroyltriglutamate--homocysteine methyltransferase
MSLPEPREDVLRDKAARSLFETTVVGSMPRPLFLKELFDEFHEGKIAEGERERLLDEAVPFAIALQEAAGVDIVSDGEWRRFSYVGVISDVTSGITRGLSGAKREGKYWHTVTGEVKATGADVLARHARFAIAHSKRPVKVALPSPYLLSVRMWDESLSKSAYPTREAFGRAIVLSFARRRSRSPRRACTRCKSTIRTSASSWTKKCEANSPTPTQRPCTV